MLIIRPHITIQL